MYISPFDMYLSMLVKYQKQFLIIGNILAVTHKTVYPLFLADKLWLGVSPRGMLFDGPLEPTIGMGNVVWYTNLDHGHRLPPIELTERYCPDRYPAYDNFAAIDVSRVKDIPLDYDGVIGVPINYISKHCPEQFELLGVVKPVIDGQEIFTRVLIRHRSRDLDHHPQPIPDTTIEPSMGSLRRERELWL